MSYKQGLNKKVCKLFTQYLLNYSAQTSVTSGNNNCNICRVFNYMSAINFVKPLYFQIGIDKIMICIQQSLPTKPVSCCHLFEVIPGHTLQVEDRCQSQYPTTGLEIQDYPETRANVS